MDGLYGRAPGARSLAESKHTLRQCQKQGLEDMLRSALPLDASGKPAPLAPLDDGTLPTVWRLLIFDDWGRDIIAPLLRVGDLRELGVTLYMHISTERDPVPGAPAVYLCAPTAANVERIAQDCAQTLYEWVYVNFTSPVPRPLLESFAMQLAGCGLPSVQHVKVFDRGLNYVALDNDLFSLMLPNSFHTLNKRGIAEAEMEAHLNAVVTGVHHVLLSQQTLPVIVHSKTGAAEEVARRLTVRLNDSINEHRLVPAPAGVLGRPLLLLVDRSSDLASALHHPFTYRGLMVDMAGMRLNKCTVVDKDGGADVLELDPERDTFYRENAAKPYGEIGASIETALKQVKEEFARVSDEGDEADADTDANTVSRKMAQVPVVTERKRCLDAHVKLAFSFLSGIQKNGLDSFHGVERAVLLREGLDTKEFCALLEGQRGSLQDRQRLFLIVYLMGTEGGEEEEVLRRMEETFDKAAFPALAYLKHLRNWSVSAGSPSTRQQPKGSGASAMEGFGWGFAQQIAKNIASTLGGSAETALPLTKVVDALLQDQPAAGSPSTGQPGVLRARLLDTLAAYDPRTRRPVDLRETHFSQVIVFALGGGSINEYDDLKRWESDKPRKAVSYGCTAITSGNEMLAQLSLLGSEL